MTRQVTNQAVPGQKHLPVAHSRKRVAQQTREIKSVCFSFPRPSKRNPGKCLSPAHREKSFPALHPNYSLVTQDFSAPNGTLNYTGAQERPFRHPQQGQPGLSPPTLPSGNGESELFIKTAAATLEILLFGKITRLMTPTTISSCPGELQSEVEKMGRKRMPHQ